MGFKQISGGTSGGGGVTLPIAESDVTNLTTDLAAKAPLASPTLTGTVTLPDTVINGTVDGAYTLDGLDTMDGVDLTNCTVTAAPSSGSDIVNKTYADSLGGGGGDRPLNVSPTAGDSSTVTGFIETTFDKFVTIPANSLRAGDLIMFRVAGHYSTTSAAPLVYIGLQINGASQYLIALPTAGSDTDAYWYMNADYLVASIGGSGVLVPVNVNHGILATYSQNQPLHSSVTVDTTADILIKPSGNFSDSSASTVKTKGVFGMIFGTAA